MLLNSFLISFKVQGCQAKYHLKKADGARVVVCRKMFLGTHGYHPINSSVIESLWKSARPSDPVPPLSIRGMNPAPNRIEREEIKEYLMSYNPVKPHYRLKHAPNRLYMPPELDVSTIHQRYMSGVRDGSVRGPQCAYTTFLKVVK